MIRNIDKKHRFRVADTGGHGDKGSSEVPTPKLPKDHQIPHGVYGSCKPRGSPAKSCAKGCATDRELGRLWNMALQLRSTIKQSYRT